MADSLLIFRAAENFEGAAILAQDPILKRLAAAWPQVPRTIKALSLQEAPETLEEAWRGVWLSFERWESLAQVSPIQATEGYLVLRGNGIILPDGTLNHTAEQLLRKDAAGQLLADFGIKPGDLKK